MFMELVNSEMNKMSKDSLKFIHNVLTDNYNIKV